MESAVRDVLNRAAARGFDERLEDVKGSYRFDIDGVGSFRIEVDHGRLAIREDKSRSPADCVIGCSEQDFLKFATGEQNMLTAYMQGRVQVEGDLALAKLLEGILPGPGREKREEAAP
jgi:putative sterol carrier protein